jgi:hypothetical protein
MSRSQIYLEQAAKLKEMASSAITADARKGLRVTAEQYERLSRKIAESEAKKKNSN